MYGLQTALSPRRTNCKIQRNIKYKEDNLRRGKILDENLNWNSQNNSHPYPYPYPHPPTLALGVTLTLVLATPSFTLLIVVLSTTSASPSRVLNFQDGVAFSSFFRWFSTFAVPRCYSDSISNFLIFPIPADHN